MHVHGVKSALIAREFCEEIEIESLDEISRRL